MSSLGHQHYLLQVLKKEKKLSSICPLFRSGILGHTGQDSLALASLSRDSQWLRNLLVLLYLGQLAVGAVQLLPQRLVHPGLLPLQQQRRATQIHLVQVGPLVVPPTLLLHPLDDKKEATNQRQLLLDRPPLCLVLYLPLLRLTLLELDHLLQGLWRGFPVRLGCQTWYPHHAGSGFFVVIQLFSLYLLLGLRHIAEIHFSSGNLHLWIPREQGQQPF